MYMLRSILLASILNLLCFCYAFAEEIYPLTFDQLGTPALSNVENKQVRIRGFLYQNAQGEWILASQPNLKSCCVGTPSKFHQQIFISNHLSPASTAYVSTIEGIFRIHSHNLYRLEQAYLIEESHFPIFEGIFMVFLGMGGWLLYRSKNRVATLLKCHFFRMN